MCIGNFSAGWFSMWSSHSHDLFFTTGRDSTGKYSPGSSHSPDLFTTGGLPSNTYAGYCRVSLSWVEQIWVEQICIHWSGTVDIETALEAFEIKK